MTDEPLTSGVVNCGLLGPDGMPALVVRPMDAEEATQRRADMAAAVVALEATPPKTPLELLADVLAAKAPDEPVTASELLAILRPKENPDA